MWQYIHDALYDIQPALVEALNMRGISDSAVARVKERAGASSVDRRHPSSKDSSLGGALDSGSLVVRRFRNDIVLVPQNLREKGVLTLIIPSPSVALSSRGRVITGLTTTACKT